MPKKKKSPLEMTTDEAIRHLFHPRVVEELKRHVKEINEKASKPVKKKATK
jgi:hypothetical protein